MKIFIILALSLSFSKNIDISKGFKQEQAKEYENQIQSLFLTSAI